MGTSPERAGFRTRLLQAWPALAVTAFAGVLAVLLWNPAAVGVFFDDGIYALLGKALANGDGLRYTGVAGAPPAPKYPPLYPLTLAAVWKAAPTFPANAEYLKAVGVVCAVIAAGVFAWYLERSLRFPTWFSVTVAAGAWLTVEVWRYAVVPLSEPLFVLTLVLGFAAAARVDEAPDSTRATILLLAAFAAAYYTRTIAIILPAGVITAHVLRRRWRSAGLTAVGAVLIALPWLLWTRAVADGVPAPLQDVLGGYTGHLGSQFGADPRQYLLGLPVRVVEVGRRMLEAVLPGVPGSVRLAVAPLFAVIGGIGFVRLWRRSPSTVIGLMAYVAVLWVWPFVGRRLVAPITPWLILAVAAGFRELYVAAADRVRLVAVVRLGAIAWAAAFVLGNAAALYTRQHDLVHMQRSLALAWAVRAVRDLVPPHAVVVAPELWAGLHLYTGRPVAPSVRFRPFASGAGSWGSVEEQLEIWRTVDAEFVLLELGGVLNRPTLLRIQNVCGGDAVRLAARSNGMDLVRLVLDDGCRASLGWPRARG